MQTYGYTNTWEAQEQLIMAKDCLIKNVNSESEISQIFFDMFEAKQPW